MKGYLRVCVHIADRLFPVKNAEVEVSRIVCGEKKVISNMLTDENGYTKELALETDKKDGGKIFGVYRISVKKESFSETEGETVLFPGKITVYSVDLIMRETA